FFRYGTALTYIFTLSLHDALPISQFLFRRGRGVLSHVIATTTLRPHDLEETAHGQNLLWRARRRPPLAGLPRLARRAAPGQPRGDRKSTRLNSSHQIISYAVFCLK